MKKFILLFLVTMTICLANSEFERIYSYQALKDESKKFDCKNSDSRESAEEAFKNGVCQISFLYEGKKSTANALDLISYASLNTFVKKDRDYYLCGLALAEYSTGNFVAGDSIMRRFKKTTKSLNSTLCVKALNVEKEGLLLKNKNFGDTSNVCIK